MVDVIYEDNHIIVCTKPQNVATQADISGDEDMLNMVKMYVKEKYNKQGNVYVGLVHRLDRPTGGVMVFAKTSKAAGRLCEQIKQNIFKKKYYAVVVGEPRIKTATLKNYLKKDEKENIVKIVPQTLSGAKYAELSYNTLKTNNKLSLVDVDLKTGRSHQIRVQLAYNGNPIFGDAKYSTKINGQNLSLWAYYLEFIHPTTKQKMTFKVLPPMETQPWKNFEDIISKN
ncbi:MAG: RluA family pseudouridine synthase [Clostridia bacterium]|nr:RluA family pseudouridine synthase [Clostridia bacterium]